MERAFCKLYIFFRVILKFNFMDRRGTPIEIVPPVLTRFIIQYLSDEKIQAAAISINATFRFPHNISSMIK